MLRIGAIGYGARVSGLVDRIDELKAGVALVAVADPQTDKVNERLKSQDREGVTLYSDADEMLDAQTLDGVFVGTRCSLHATMAQKVLARDIPLYLEKPVATDMDDLRALAAAAPRKYRTQGAGPSPLPATSWQSDWMCGGLQKAPRRLDAPAPQASACWLLRRQSVPNG